MSEINVPLLRKVLEHITAHPEEHDQTQWAERYDCGTTFCLAGHAALMEGWSPIFGDYDNLALLFQKGDESRHVPSIAADALGLDDGQANRMFMVAETIDDLWNLAEEFTDGEIAVPVGGSETGGN